MEVNKNKGLETKTYKTIELNEHILIEWEKKDYGPKTPVLRLLSLVFIYKPTIFLVDLKRNQILTFTMLRENFWVYKKTLWTKKS